MRSSLCPRFGCADGVEMLRERHAETPTASFMHLQQNPPPKRATRHPRCARYLWLLH